MVTRAKNGNYKRKVLLSYLSNSRPNNVQEALAHSHWSQIVHDEYTTLTKNETWSLTPSPPDRRAVGCKCVFKLKKNPNGSISKYKTLLVAKGFYQQAGLDFS